LTGFTKITLQTIALPQNYSPSSSAPSQRPPRLCGEIPLSSPPKNPVTKI
jgi:hypothetical protein